MGRRESKDLSHQHSRLIWPHPLALVHEGPQRRGSQRGLLGRPLCVQCSLDQQRQRSGVGHIVRLVARQESQVAQQEEGGGAGCSVPAVSS